ncbi:hypothetical protein A4V15_14210 [Pseudomonas oryzihabitans]|uniref:HEAT repeat domain-containing protein n=1 Tax=Pseudomonas oryzihabitans TaxID=47885 RepID=A0A178LLD2_9PSED|nr:hypothetical protein A4V15_14210 [Pseudomonas oryzihabitans]
MVSRTTAIEMLAVVAQDTRFLESVRIGAVEGLGYAGGEHAREALVKIMGGDQHGSPLRAAAAKALGRAASFED